MYDKKFINHHKKTVLANSAWQSFTIDSAAVLISGNSRVCEGGCEKTIEFGNIAIKVFDHVAPKYYCQKCYDKLKQKKVGEKYGRLVKRNKPNDPNYGQVFPVRTSRK